MKFQANVPFKLTKMFYEKLGEQPTDTRILVIRDFFTAMHAAIDNAVTFVTDDKEAYELFNKNVVSNDEFGNNDTVLFVDTEINKNAWKDFIKEIVSMPKFDVAIMNPPYDKNLHLKILEAVIPIAEKVVNISPSAWMAKHNINLPKGKYRKIFKNKIEDFHFIPHREMNDLFNLGNAIEDGAITVFSNNGTFDVANYGFENEIEKSIYNKIDFYENENCLTMSSAKSRNEFGGTAEDFRNNNIKFYTPIYQWHGAENCYDACVITNKKHIEKGCSYFCFKTQNEKYNFEQSLKTEFMDWFYYNYIVPGDYKQQAYLFRMKDYTQPWDNARFCKVFGITNEEWQYMLTHMNKPAIQSKA